MIPSRVTPLPDIAPETCLRLLDAAMIELLKQLSYSGSKFSHVYAGWGSRYYSAAADIDEVENIGVRQRLPLPRISLQHMSARPAPERWVGGEIRQIAPGPIGPTTRIFANTDGAAPTEGYALPWPFPLDVTYQIEIWTKTAQAMRGLRTALFLLWSRFNPVEMFIEVEYPPPYGVKLIPLKMEGDSSVGSLEGGEDDRELRHAFTVTASAWIFLAPIRRKLIHQTNVAYIDGDAGDEAVRAHFTNVGSNWTFDVDGMLLSIADYIGSSAAFLAQE